MRSPSIQRALPLLELGGLLLVALLCLVFHLRLPSKLPSEESYRAVAERLKAEGRPGDAVLLFPWWAERARLFVPPGLPVYGYLGSDHDDLSAHPRVWVLGQPELPRSDEATFLKDFLPERRAVGPVVQEGTLTLSLYENGRHRPRRFNAADRVAQARVYLESLDGTRAPCPFDGTAHRCPGPGNVYVATEWHEVFYEPRHCLWMPAPGGARRLVAEFDGVPGGVGLRLEGGIIFEYAFPRDAQLTTAFLGVEDAASGAPLVEVAIPPGQEGVKKSEVLLPPGEARTVKVWVRSENPDRRQVCLDVLALEPVVGVKG
ncbi:hypothetical protein MYSTI_06213 [Myxococcus stipitatus DSM 14675]|uniref:Uncharacterized protein n=1 Tax=Myxococcus stipitatus (strain DSM 14675 / JCM 12634 / Mx s8) TaxID=1278073 RepID=L7UEZ9_MYXSD|nr:hypothetical protein [Myxococcus stipitatus]AGC47486.1 hypothetical protein MYSTI_06213 [Myxococcus stipitatus DSM 14675]